MSGENDSWPEERNVSLPQDVDAGLKDAWGLEGLRSSMPDDASMKSMAERYQVLSDPVRLSIVYL